MTKSLAKTIEIFLPDGDPKSIKVARITSRTVEVTYIPRAKLDEAKKRTNLNRVGVYMLVGTSDEHSKPEIYIGEAENCIVRLAKHNSDMDFWHYALVITSLTDQFTKAHGKYLEWLCYDIGKQTRRCSINNRNVPTKPYVSIPMEADLHESFEIISVLVSTLGMPLFQPARGNEPTKDMDPEMIFYARGRGGDATGLYTDEGFVILAGSKFAKELSPSMEKNRGYLKVRDQLIADGILVDKQDYYQLLEDSVFPSPSNAGASVTGLPTNGWTAWKLKDGRTLSDVYRKQDSA